MSLTASLENYPTSTPAVIPVTFYYRECFPFNFEFNVISEVVEVYAGETAEDIDVSVS